MLDVDTCFSTAGMRVAFLPDDSYANQIVWVSIENSNYFDLIPCVQGGMMGTYAALLLREVRMVW